MSETLGLMLVRANKITRAQLYEALREQRKNPGSRLGDILFSHGWLSEDDLAFVIAKQSQLEFIDEGTLKRLPAGIADKVPKKVAEEYHVVPVKLAKGRLTLAMEDQRTRNYMDELSYLVGCTCLPAVASPRAVREALTRLYGLDATTLAPVKKPPAASADPAGEDDTHELRPARKLEALPEAKVDSAGRAVASMKNASGEDVVYLLTEVTDLAPVADLQGDATVQIRVNPNRPKSKESKAASQKSQDKTQIIPVRARNPHPVAAKEVNKHPAPEEPSQDPATSDEPHDNFLAPEAKDDERPMWRPKGAGEATPVPTPLASGPGAPPAQRDESDGDASEFDIVRAAERLFECTSTAEIGNVIVRFARNLVQRAMIFELDGPVVRCIATTNGLESENRGKEYPAETLVLLGVIGQNKQPAYGPTPSGEMYDRFFESIGTMRPPVILLYPLVVGGSTSCVLYAGLAAPRPPDEFGDLQLLFKEAATALEILAS